MVFEKIYNTGNILEALKLLEYRSMSDNKLEEPVTQEPNSESKTKDREENDAQKGSSATIDIESGNERTSEDNYQSGKNTYEDIYRSGNFGIALGRVNTKIGKQWILVHAIISSLILTLTISGNVLLKKYYTVSVLDDLAIAFTWCISILSLISTVIGLYLFQNLKGIGYPYRILMTLRFSAIFTNVFILFAVIFVAIILASKTEKAFIGETEATGIKANYGLMMILFIFGMFSNTAFSCNACGGACCNDCGCGEWCIYSEGEELAPGVPNPPSTAKFQMAAAVLQGVSDELDKHS